MASSALRVSPEALNWTVEIDPSLMAVRTPSVFATLHLKAADSNGLNPPPPNPTPFPRLSFSKPSWIVRTESNVRRERRKKPDPPCVKCNGSGRVDCHQCRGRGRTNFVEQAMLPKGEWPKWCRSCRGSGLSYCSRCLGTGEYRYIMGFQFMKMENNGTQDHKKNENHQANQPHCPSADHLLLHNEQLSSDPEI